MATIKEIAQIIGVSPSTVSIVLNGNAEKRKIKQETADRVLKVAEQLGYRPSMEARRLRAIQEGDVVQEKTIGIFWTVPLTETTLVRFLQGFQRGMEQVGAEYKTNIYFYDRGKLSEFAHLFDNSHFHSAIIYSPGADDADFLENCAFVGTKIIVNNNLRRPFARCHVVQSDIRIAQVMEAMARSGGERFGYCLSSATIDFDACESDAQKIGMESHFDGQFVQGSIQGGYDWVMQHYKGKEKPYQYDCVMCASERMALGVTRGLKELGINIPNDVRLIAMNVYSLNIEEFITPRLSWIELPMENMAKAALQILNATELELNAEPQKIIVTSRVYINESIGFAEA